MRKLIWNMAMPIVVAFIFIGAWNAPLSSAQTIEELKKSVQERNEEIQKLEEEAAKYRQEIASRQEAAQTLKGELSRIDQTLSQLKREISVTQSRIAGKELEIKVALSEIQEKESSIINLKRGLGSIVRTLFEGDRRPLIATLISKNALSDFFSQLNSAATFQDRILQSLHELRKLQQGLETQKSQAEKKKSELQDLGTTLRGRKQVQEGERGERDLLLNETKNQEQQYQRLLKEREVRRAALEEEVRSIEAKMRFSIDPESLPHKGNGILGWPLPNLSLSACRTSIKLNSVINCITQYFGYTSFAAIGGYNGKGHNGSDFRADIGTPILASESGTVSIGDTDIGCRGASYGKWILIRHPNNLSTLYAHLSAINVTNGQGVARGDRIGYSGKSGYATGPHLHFSVFAAAAVRIDSIVSRVCGRTMVLPISPSNGYLDPLDYL